MVWKMNQERFSLNNSTIWNRDVQNELSFSGTRVKPSSRGVLLGDSDALEEGRGRILLEGTLHAAAGQQIDDVCRREVSNGASEFFLF